MFFTFLFNSIYDHMDCAQPPTYWKTLILMGNFRIFFLSKLKLKGCQCYTSSLYIYIQVAQTHQMATVKGHQLTYPWSAPNIMVANMYTCKGFYSSLLYKYVSHFHILKSFISSCHFMKFMNMDEYTKLNGTFQGLH